MNSDALGLFSQIVENRFSFKANEFKNEIAHCVYGASRSYVLIYNVRDQIQTYMVIACVFMCFAAVVVCVCVLCCVCNSINTNKNNLFSMCHFFFAFRKYLVRQNFLYIGDGRKG
jgi:hypothetical protein